MARRIPFVKLKRRLSKLRTRAHSRKGQRLAALDKAAQILRECKGTGR